MEILSNLGSEKELDAKLDDLVLGILPLVRTDPPEPELEHTIQTLRFLRGTDLRDINAQCLKAADGSVVVHVGQGLYAFLHVYMRAVVAKAASAPQEETPSASWPEALEALASSLEWLALPVSESHLPTIVLSSTRDIRATTYANLAYRAMICHEIAHVALGHLNAAVLDSQNLDLTDTQRLGNQRDRELRADVVGMQLHLYSLPDPASMVLPAALGFVFGAHATSLLRYRLMELAQVVDTELWSGIVRHPDPLLRIASVSADVESRLGSELARAITGISQSLEAVGGELRECHVDQRGSVESQVLALARRPSRSSAYEEPSFEELLARSPIGVIRALDILAQGSDSAGFLQRTVEALPRSLQRFFRLSFADRTRRALNKVT